nr:acyl carrier protein [Streptomyces spiramenti]
MVDILAGIHDAPSEHLTPGATLNDLDVDSLTLVELALRVERNLGVHIDDADLHGGLTLAGTAELIDRARTGETAVSAS